MHKELCHLEFNLSLTLDCLRDEALSEDGLQSYARGASVRFY